MRLQFIVYYVIYRAVGQKNDTVFSYVDMMHVNYKTPDIYTVWTILTNFPSIIRSWNVLLIYSKTFS